MKNINQKLINEIENHKKQLLDLLKTWHYYQTEVLQEIMFAYENIFGNIESEIETKDRAAKNLERKYQIIASKVNRGEKITKNLIEFIDKLIEKDRNREANNPFRHAIHRGRAPQFKFQNKILDTKYNDQFDLSQLYHQIVKRLHPDIVGESTAFRACWDNVQYCYKKQDVDRLKMFYLILCHEFKNNIEDVQFNENVLRAEIAELKKCIIQQTKDLNDLQKQEPFCFDKKLEDSKWIIERKNLLRNKLIQINKRIIHNNKLIRAVNIVD